MESPVNEVNAMDFICVNPVREKNAVCPSRLVPLMETKSCLSKSCMDTTTYNQSGALIFQWQFIEIRKTLGNVRLTGAVPTNTFDEPQ